MNRQRLLERFLRYVQIDTMARDDTDDYPSSPGQWELGQLLVTELREMGVAEVEQDAHGLVWATLPGRVPDAPPIAFNAHLDTSPETSGANVRPQTIDAYPGGDIPLPGDPSKMIRVEDNPELRELVGQTLITTDGTTLLGGDDKAGIAVILEAVHWLTEHPHIQHGPLRLVFTCDEEIGRGVQYLDVARVEAVACYTLDGGGADQIDVETFSADLATLCFRGVNIHPSIAQDRMINSLRAAGAFLSRLPRKRLAPESTSDREGFMHPYVVEGGVAETVVKVLLRDFDSGALVQQAELIRQLADKIRDEFPGLEIDIAIRPQYRNLGEGLAREPRAVEYAVQAHRRLGREPEQSIIRGGTDGSMLTERGLPTPNLSTGQHNPHSPLEWACLDEMVKAGEVLLELTQVWAEDRSEPR